MSYTGLEHDILQVVSQIPPPGHLRALPVADISVQVDGTDRQLIWVTIAPGQPCYYRALYYWHVGSGVVESPSSELDCTHKQFVDESTHQEQWTYLIEIDRALMHSRCEWCDNEECKDNRLGALTWPLEPPHLEQLKQAVTRHLGHRLTKEAAEKDRQQLGKRRMACLLSSIGPKKV